MAIRQISGCSFQIDDEDVHILNEYSWYVNRKQAEDHGRYYFCSDHIIDGIKRSYRLHRVIMGCTYGDGVMVDHKSGDTLDNRKSNLRICSNKENTRNAKRRNTNTSGYKGVFFCTVTLKWNTRMTVDYKGINLGYYINVEDAITAYDIGALYHFKEFARLNRNPAFYAHLNIENEYKKLVKTYSSSYRGVSYDKNVEKWWARIYHDGRTHNLGYFNREVDAATTYDMFARKMKGNKATLNFNKDVDKGKKSE